MNSKEILKSHHPCPHCKCEEVAVLIGNHPGGHYAKVVCAECDRFIKWQSKPKSEKRLKKRDSKNLVLDLGKGFCELCRRKKTISAPTANARSPSRHSSV